MGWRDMDRKGNKGRHDNRDHNWRENSLQKRKSHHSRFSCKAYKRKNACTCKGNIWEPWRSCRLGWRYINRFSYNQKARWTCCWRLHSRKRLQHYLKRRQSVEQEFSCHCWEDRRRNKSFSRRLLCRRQKLGRSSAQRKAPSWRSVRNNKIWQGSRSYFRRWLLDFNWLPYQASAVPGRRRWGQSRFHEPYPLRKTRMGALRGRFILEGRRHYKGKQWYVCR